MSVVVDAHLALEGGPGKKLCEKLIHTCIPE